MFDISQEEDYRELTLEEQYLVNGGKEIENSIAAQADASVGDTVTDSNGKTSTLTQGDINWAQKVMAERNGSGGNSGADSGSPSYGPSGNSGGSSGSGSDNSSNNNNPFANNNTPWGAAEQMEAARLAKEKAKSYVDGLKANEVTAEVVGKKESSSKTSNFIKRLEKLLFSYIVPSGNIDINIVSNNKTSIFSEGIGIKDFSTNSNKSQKTLIQASLGKRKTLGLGYSYSFGAAVNPNNYWDSGILLSVGLGVGLEGGYKLTKNVKVNQIINVASSTIDFTKPTKTSDIEGISFNEYVCAGGGFSLDMEKKKIKGVTLGGFGGGVYCEGTTVITAGEIVESVYNIGTFIINQSSKFSGLLGKCTDSVK